jgi:hypothetical protein
MSTLLYTVDNLIAEVRAQLDEFNVDSVSTTQDILPTLNRAQDYAFDILARKYPEPILANQTLLITGGQVEYDIPDNVFADHIQKMEVIVPSRTGNATYREIQRISYRDLTNYESTTKTNVPYYYCIYGRKIRLIPVPTGTYNIRMWYLRNPEKLTPPQGRITSISGTSNYVIVDSAGSSLTTEADQLGSYVNLVDGQTGEIKGSLQIQILSENKLTFRSTPLRSNVLGRTISSSVASLTGMGLDDYFAPIDGTCVPYYSKPVCNFLVQYTVAEITRKLGGAAELEEKILEKFEKQVERTWVGRETQLRVKKKSPNWGVPINRWWYQ